MCAALLVIHSLLEYNYRKGVEQTIKESPVVQAVGPKLTGVPAFFPDREPPLVGLIVETRPHHNLIPVIENFRTVLPDVPIYVIHGTLNAKVLQDTFGDQSDIFRFIQMDVDNLTIRQYNYLMTMPSLWAGLQGRHVLVFQTDSVLFSKSKVRLDSFFKYDYVGAPWRSLYKHYVRNAFLFRALDYHTSAGNGGLSLRRRETMLKVCEQFPYLSIPYASEDVYFSNAMEHMTGASVPEQSVAATFSYESILADQLPFGAHKFYPDCFSALITPSERDILLGYKPEKK